MRNMKFNSITDRNGPKRKYIQHNVFGNNGKGRILLAETKLWQLVDEIMEISSMIRYSDYIVSLFRSNCWELFWKIAVLKL